MRHMISRTSLGAGAALVVAAMLCLVHGQDTAGTTQPADPQTIAEGKYLVYAGDCVACHTAVGGAPFAGGTVINTPFGKLLGPNITPDVATGIGGWTDDQFVRAVKYGIGHRDHYLYPGLPYIYFNKVPRADILKIRAYLATLPPVNNRIHADQLPFPFSIRLGMFGWDLLFFPKTGDYQPDPNQSAEWNRGAYLVQGLGHCAACHTPKNLLGGDRTHQELQGAVVNGWNAPPLVNDQHTGLAAWSADDIETYLKTGHNAFADSSGDMADVVTHSTSHLTDADDKAIAVYLKSLPGSGVAPLAPIAATDPAMIAGGHIYADECAACHTGAGTGLPLIFPALAVSPIVQAETPATLLQIVLHGGRSVATTTAPTASAMPAFGGQLTDQEIADVSTYLRNSWGNAAPAVSAEQVAKVR